MASIQYNNTHGEAGKGYDESGSVIGEQRDGAWQQLRQRDVDFRELAMAGVPLDALRPHFHVFNLDYDQNLERRRWSRHVEDIRHADAHLWASQGDTRQDCPVQVGQEDQEDPDQALAQDGMEGVRSELPSAVAGVAGAEGWRATWVDMNCS